MNHFGGKRYTYIADRLRDLNHEVIMLTSSFSHKEKRQKDDPDRKYIRYYHEKGYPTNVCPQRLLSHSIAGISLDKALSSIERPDLVYSSIPTITAGERAAKWAMKWNAPLVIDIQDLWPEQFKMAVNVPVVSDALFAPITYRANRLYSKADYVVAVSETYVQRALAYNDHAEGKCVYLGTELDDFDIHVSSEKDSVVDGRIRVAYIGTLGTSYDLPTVIRAMAGLRNQIDMQLIVMGDGPRRVEFQMLADELGVDSLFYGTLPYDKMICHLTACDIATNPFVATAPHSIVNKVGDYAAAGLPVINTLGTQEYRSVLEEYGAGINCLPEDVDGFADALKELALNESLRREMGAANRRLAEERFDKNRTYSQLIEGLVELAG